MTITTEEFTSTFHSLSGTTIGEKRKNLFLLLRQIQDPETIDVVSIQPQTPLEEKFRVETLIYFKKVPELMEALKTEDPVLIERILKESSWFLKEMLENIKGEDLVKSFFPKLSFNAKQKLLKNLSYHLKNTQQADEIFNVVRQKYGFYLASKLLPACSGNTIINCIKSARVEITPRQLLMIVKSHPQLTESILRILIEFSDRSSIQCKYENVYKYVLRNDVSLFLKLGNTFRSCFRIGWRATDKLVVRNKEDVLQNAEIFYNVLHRKQIIKSVSQDFNQFYLNFLPTSLERLKNEYNIYLELIPMNVHKIDVMLNTFKNKYGHELWDDPQFVTPGLLELMNPDEREAWMQTHERPKHIEEDIWICLMKTDKSIPLLKKRIALVHKIRERAELVGCLVETCRINNKDKVALLKACKYMMQHRSDDSAVIISFLNTLKRCFDINTLDDKHWKYINEMVQVNITRGMIPYHYMSWLFDYIGYRISNKLPIKKELKELEAKVYVGNLVSQEFSNSQTQKEYLLVLAELVPELYGAEQADNNRLTFINRVLKWNKKYPKNQIASILYRNVFEGMIEELKTKDEFSYMLNMVLSDYLRLRMDESERIALLDFCFSKKNINLEFETIEWLMKYQPCLILRYIVPVTDNILNLWYTLIKPLLWQHCRNYTHLEIPQKVTSICLNIINNDDNDSRKKNAITALSYLMPPEDFLNFIGPYYPTGLVMDVNNEENQETYKIQQAITGSLKNVIPPSCILQSVLNFSKGDYLKFIQRSLSSVSQSVAEEKLPFLFLSLADRAVSVRKHAIYQTFKVMDKTEILKMLKYFMEKDKNSSIRKFLFCGIFNYFSKNPDDYLWELVKENVRAVDINDEEAFTTLMEIKKVPPIFLPQYMMFTWEFLETLPNPQKFENGKIQIIDAVTANIIPSLTKEFSIGIIKKYLFKSRELAGFQTKMFFFTSKFILFIPSESEMEERLKIVFVIIKEFINTTWYQSGSKTMGRNFIFAFIKEFCSFFYDKKSLAKNGLVKFIELWNDIFKPHDAFEEYLYLQLSLIYIDYVVDNLSLIQVGQKFANLCDSLLGVYGNALANIFFACLASHVGHFLTNDLLEMNRFVLIEGIITASASTNCFAMAVSLLPQDVPDRPNLKVIYNRMINLLEQNSDVVVQLYLSFYYDNLARRTIVDIPTEKRFTRKDSGRIKSSWARTVMEYNCKYEK